MERQGSSAGWLENVSAGGSDGVQPRGSGQLYSVRGRGLGAALETSTVKQWRWLAIMRTTPLRRKLKHSTVVSQVSLLTNSSQICLCLRILLQESPVYQCMQGSQRAPGPSQVRFRGTIIKRRQLMCCQRPGLFSFQFSLDTGWGQWINSRIICTWFLPIGAITERNLGAQGKCWAILSISTSIFKAPLTSLEWKLLPCISPSVSWRINSLNSSGLNSHPNTYFPQFFSVPTLRYLWQPSKLCQDPDTEFWAHGLF